MSLIPSGPGARPNSSVSAPPAREGRVSAAVVFTDAPRVTGADHGSRRLFLVAAQMSWTPRVPARLDEKTTSRPSLRTFGWMSFAPGSFSSATGVAGPKLNPARPPPNETHAHAR